MFKKFELNEFVIEHNWKNQDDRDTARKILTPVTVFTNVPAYRSSVELYAYCFKDHFRAQGNLYMVDYGYALDVNSIEKYCLDKYGDTDSNEYLLGVCLLSMDNEKYYKWGTFIDLDGKNTDMDFYDVENHNELKQKAQYKNGWLSFVIYDINRNCRGELFPEREYPDRWFTERVGTDE